MKQERFANPLYKMLEGSRTAATSTYRHVDLAPEPDGRIEANAAFMTVKGSTLPYSTAETVKVPVRFAMPSAPDTASPSSYKPGFGKNEP